jgi:hypothetical protein
MIKLLIHRPETGHLTENSFGGLPVTNANEAFEWPHCIYCKGPMQFLGKLSTDKGLEQIFMCQNDPGVCEEWDPDEGSNKVLVTQPKDLVQVESPAEGEATRNTEYGCTIVEYDSDDYEDARINWAKENKVSSRQVLGQLHGEPAWIQGNETPICDICKKPMRFVAQLEQGPDYETEMNFGGGGCAYLFDCSCPNSAKFLFQC